MTWLESAREALGHFRKGLDVKEIKPLVGERYSVDVRRMINLAESEERYLANELTSDEVTLIRNVGSAQLSGLEHGDSCPPKLKYCGAVFWRRGKAERVARKRLDTHRKGEDPANRGSGLALLDAYHGGYVCLRPAGWALFHALKKGAA